MTYLTDRTIKTFSKQNELGVYEALGLGNKVDNLFVTQVV